METSDNDDLCRHIFKVHNLDPSKYLTNVPQQILKELREEEEEDDEEDEEKALCPVKGCKVKCSQNAHLYRHIRTVHKVEPNKLLKNCSKLKKRASPANKKWICEVEGCGQQLSRKDHLKRHMDTVHGAKKQPTTYQYAKRTENDDEDDDCAGVVLTEEDEILLEQALAAAEAESSDDEVEGGEMPLKTFKCDQCEESFENKGLLTNHYKKAHTDRLVNCSVCGKGFATYERLKVHLSTHTTERNYECRQGCGSRYKMAKHRNRHEVKCSGRTERN